MLVLAGLVTLSILGSIAAMSNDVAAGAFTVERRAPQPVEAGPEQVPSEPQPQSEPVPDEGIVEGVATGAPGGAGAALAVPPNPLDEIARWLEALTYALLALAGLAAIGLILLWQALRQLRRIADSAAARPRN